MTTSSRNTAASPLPAVKKRGQPADASTRVTETTEKLCKPAIVDRMVEGSAPSTHEAGSMLDAALEIIVDALRAGTTVGLPGGWPLDRQGHRRPNGVRPNTTERIEIPAGKKVNFEAAADVKHTIQIQEEDEADQLGAVGLLHP